MAIRLAAACCAAAISIAAIQGVPLQSPNATLTAVPGVKVGHHTLAGRPTGCTVILTEAGATAGVDVRGSAPATRETDLLNPVNIVQQVHAIVLSGGSAFGLDSAGGVMKYLEEKQIGFKFGSAHVPIVPGASLFDLGIGDPAIRPGADCGYQAAKAATECAGGRGERRRRRGRHHRQDRRRRGAGDEGRHRQRSDHDAGRADRGGPRGRQRGRRRDRSRHRPGRRGRADRRRQRPGGRPRAASVGRGTAGGRGGENTTLGVVATNATLTKTQATRVAQMAHDGYARAISPSHTPVDGDTIFAVATGVRTGDADLGRIGALAAEVMADAIVRAARQATGIPGYPAARDLKR